jgi:hypothetical protein
MTLSKSRRQLIFSITALGLVGLWCYMPVKTALTKALFFTPVEAKVVNTGQLCRVFGLIPEAQAYIDKDPQWARGAWGACGNADSYIASGNTRYHQMELIQKFPQYVVTFDYIAPSDGSKRTVQLQAVSLGMIGIGGEFEIGKTMKILGHKKDPEKASLS